MANIIKHLVKTKQVSVIDFYRHYYSFDIIEEFKSFFLKMNTNIELHRRSLFLVKLKLLVCVKSCIISEPTQVGLDLPKIPQ